MSVGNFAIVFIATACITDFYRALSFLFFSKVKVSDVLNRLKDYLPAAFMAVLVVYCFFSVPEINWMERMYMVAGALATVTMHAFKHNTVLSVAVGAAVYMFLLNVI